MSRTINLRDLRQFADATLVSCVKKFSELADLCDSVTDNFRIITPMIFVVT